MGEAVAKGRGPVPAICGLCPQGCWVRVRVDAGRIHSVAADPDPRYGNLCERGRLAPEVVYSPDRIRTPLVRTGPKGTVAFRPATWDEALDRIAGEFLKIRDAHGASAVASYFGAGTLEDSVYELFDKVLAPFGSPNDMDCGSICYVSSRVLAPVTTLGIAGASLEPDFDNAEVILLWGTNPLKDGLPDKMRRIRAARARGARLIVVDPRRHRLARDADAWIPVRPGTDGALALSLLHVCLREGWYDRDFVEQWTEGFSALADYVQGFSPEVAEALCGVEAQAIEELAETLGRARGVALDFYSGVEYAPSGTQNARALYALLAVTGNVDVEGGLLVRDTPHEVAAGAPLPQGPPPLGAREHPLFFALTGRAHLSGLPAAVLEDDPYPVRALLLVGGSPRLSHPDPETWERVYERLDFLAVVDRVLPEEAAWADVVLPAATYYEISSFQRYRDHVRLRERVIEPVGEARNDALILSALAERLGCGGLPGTEEEVVERALGPEAGLLDRLRRTGAAVPSRRPEPRRRKYETGHLRADGRPGFPTPSGKLELASTLLARHGYDPLPVYTAPEEPDAPPAERLLLTTGARSRLRFNSQYLDHPKLASRQRAALEIHPMDAAARGIRSGDRVSIHTGRGRLHLEARVTPHIRPGAVHAPRGGGGRRHLGSWRHANVNAVIPPHLVDPISGYPAVKAVACEVTRVEEPVRIAVSRRQHWSALPHLPAWLVGQTQGGLMKKLSTTLLVLVGTAFAWPAVAAGPYRYLTAPVLEQKLKAKEPVSLVDIQVEADYAKHHVTGATPTYAYPVKTAEDTAKLDAVVADLKASSAPIVIVCPRGAGGAERTYDYLKEKGLAEERLFILEKGQAGWACAELTEGK